MPTYQAGSEQHLYLNKMDEGWMDGMADTPSTPVEQHLSREAALKACPDTVKQMVDNPVIVSPPTITLWKKYLPFLLNKHREKYTKKKRKRDTDTQHQLQKLQLAQAKQNASTLKTQHQPSTVTQITAHSPCYPAPVWYAPTRKSSTMAGAGRGWTWAWQGRSTQTGWTERPESLTWSTRKLCERVQ